MRNRESHCRCLLCGMERQLSEHFAGTAGCVAFRETVGVSPALSVFPTAAELLAHLHTEQKIENGNPSKDRILAALLREASSDRSPSTARELLLLVFVPMLHRLSTQVLTRYPALSPDDIAQQVVTALLQSAGSQELARRDSHIAFALTRLLRRNAFVWGERESCGWLYGSNSEEALERSSQQDASQPIERAAFLRHFLDRCQKRGVLSDEDLQLLVQFKLGEPPATNYTNAFRQRMKRLLGKLRRAARPTRRAKTDDRQLRLF